MSQLITGLPGLINFWSHSTEFLPFLGLWLVEQFLFIFRQTSAGIELKFGEQTYWGPFSAGLTFGHAEFLLFPGLWMAKQFPAICRYTTDQIEIKFSGSIQYGPPQAWLIFDNDPLNSHCFLASDWSSSFQTNYWSDLAEIWWANPYWPLLAWLTFGHAPLNFCSFLASDLLSTFRTFADKLQIGCRLN